MTRKTALKEAINIVKNSEMDTKMKESIIEKLELCISELPFAKWTEAAIFDACDQFIEDNGRALILNDFQSKMLPSHPTVQNRFGMTLKEFRDTYYPLPEISESLQQEKREKMLQDIREEILRNGTYTREKYDKIRDKRLPCSLTILSRFHFKTWAELLEHIDVKPPKPPKRGSSIRGSTFSFKYEQLFSDDEDGE